VAPDAYVADDSLVVISGGGPWSCKGLMPQCKGMPEPGSGSGWVGEQGEG